MKILTLSLILLLSACINENESVYQLAQCGNNNGVNWSTLKELNCEKLSDYGLFIDSKNPIDNLQAPGFPYELNSTLFTDHAQKYRYLFIPNNQPIIYNDKDSFQFPVGSTLVKIFTMPTDTSSNTAKIIEIRLLIKRSSKWIGLPFIWNEAQQEGFLTFSGKKIELSLVHENVALISNYAIPSPSDCLDCHINESVMTPIGLKARHLNKTILYNNESINQLKLWEGLSLLKGLPSDLSGIDTLPNWLDTNANLQHRAKAYLDINCAHCHSNGGSAALSGLRLEYWRKDIGYSHGACNPSHGWRGGGFDIWPGDGDNSSIPIRMRHTTPTDQMPPVGRSLIDEKAATLVSLWIDSLPYKNCEP